jgi:hypothetical protein
MTLSVGLRTLVIRLIVFKKAKFLIHKGKESLSWVPGVLGIQYSEFLQSVLGSDTKTELQEKIEAGR